jgi:hypothetical protein
MSKGNVIEFDTPIALLNDPRSKLSKMVSQEKDVDMKRLILLAGKKRKDAKVGGVPMARNGSSNSQSKTSMPRSLDLFKNDGRGDGVDSSASNLIPKD